MTLLIGKADDLILDGRAVARTDAVDLARILRGAHQVITDDLVRFLIGIGEPAVSLISVLPFIHEGEGMVHRIALFERHMIQMQASDIDTARRAGLEAEDL